MDYMNDSEISSTIRVIRVFASTVRAVCDRAITSIRADRAVIDRPYNASSLTVALLDYPYGEIPYQ